MRSPMKALGDKHEREERINQNNNKIASLTQKKSDVDKNIAILKSFLKSISEEIQMT